MVDLAREQSSYDPVRGGAVRAAAAIGCGLAVATALLPFAGKLPTGAVVLVYASVAAIVVARIGPERGGRFGAANTLTLGRAAGVAAFAGFAVEPQAVAAIGAWPMMAAALALLSLDGADGWLARRQGLDTRFGARFDMEVDALFILVLAALAVGLGKAGAWILGLGLLRYAFALGGRLAPWMAAPLLPSIRRKAVCVLQIATLAALLAPPIEPPASELLAGVAFAALAWSFAVDMLWLHRRRPA
jgi:phosphatidylglycerophosphate synthase